MPEIINNIFYNPEIIMNDDEFTIYTGKSKENNDIILAIICNGFENENEKFNLIIEHFNPEIKSCIEDYNFTFTPQNNLILLHKSTDDIVIDNLLDGNYDTDWDKIS